MATFFGVFAGPFTTVFFGAALFTAAGPLVLLSALAFVRWYSAQRLRAASAMRLRPAALSFRLRFDDSGWPAGFCGRALVSVIRLTSTIWASSRAR
jgi:hypothetical protein